MEKKFHVVTTLVGFQVISGDISGTHFDFEIEFGRLCLILDIDPIPTPVRSLISLYETFFSKRDLTAIFLSSEIGFIPVQ